LKWHFAPTAACLFITFTFGGNACMGCCSCLPFFFAGEDKIGGESSVNAAAGTGFISEQIPWSIPQMGQQCWLASTDSLG
jgi:hypothetical protein